MTPIFSIGVCLRWLPVAVLVAASGLTPAARAQTPSAGPIIYSATPTSPSTIRDRAPNYAPLYLVYAERRRSADEARALIDELGMVPHINEFKARAYVVGPATGEAYDATADLAAFRSLLSRFRSYNLKIIGVGAGATFVNNVLARHAYAVAGIMTYGGSLDAGVTSSMPVPAYVHASDPRVAKLYVDANGATSRTEDSPSYTVHANPRPLESLQRVVVSKLPDARESLTQAFQNAWKTVLSKNYRFYMTEIEQYNQAFDPNKYTEPWELVPYVMFDDLGVRSEAVTEDLPGLGLSLRYDYVPLKALQAAPKSVPLVIMLHGLNNDPRQQGESSGWTEVAAKHTLMLTSVEWQGRNADGMTFAAIGEAGTMAILDRLLAKYPQIDPSRVYFAGLSAGAMHSFTYGMNNSTRIAGVAGASAPSSPLTLLEASAKAKTTGVPLPMYAIAGTRDMYKPLPVSDAERTFYHVIREFAQLNGVVTAGAADAADLSANEIFGIKLDGPGWSQLAGRRAMIGTLSNSQGVMIKLVGLDPYAHWNFKPAAEDMWAFLSQFRRDLTTGKLSRW